MNAPPAVPPFSRPRVRERLARAARRPVTLVTAAAGFGKTVALRDYVASAAPDAAFYEVAREDGTLLAFVRGLSAALHGLAPGAAASFPGIQERVTQAGDAVRELADWLGEHLKDVSGTVVIDDLHHAPAEAIALLVAVVERTHERMRWIFAARTDVGMPVDYWTASGRSDAPLGEDELRFTADEALAVACAGDPAAGGDEVEALRALTDGWPIALAIALRTRTGADDLRNAASGTREMVYRYLAEQIFAGLTRAQQRFLLASSVFSSFDLRVAKALGANAAFVDELRKDVTFVREIAPDVYRYHDLFREFLERELRRSGAAAWYRAHADGADVLEREGDEVGALALAVRVGASDRAGAILRRSGLTLVERGDVETLRAALALIPEAQRAADAALAGLGATLDAGAGAFDAAEPGFVAAIARADDGETRLRLVHRYGLELVRHGRDAIALLEPAARDPELPPAWRAPLLGTLASAYAAVGRTDDAVASASDAIAALDGAADDVQARVYQQAAFVRTFVPGREHARRFATLAAQRALACGLYEVAARAYSALYVVAGEEDDDPLEVLALLEKLREYARKGASRQSRIFGTLCAYDACAELGDEAALEALDAELAGEEASLAATAAEALLPGRALRAAWRGDAAAAYAVVAGSAERLRGDDRRALRHAEIALYAYAAGRRADGNRALRGALRALESAPAGRRVVRSHLVLALALLVAGRRADALRHLAAGEEGASPAMRRMRAFAAAVAAFASPERLAAALRALEEAHGGGLARLVAALARAPG